MTNPQSATSPHVDSTSSNGGSSSSLAQPLARASELGRRVGTVHEPNWERSISTLLAAWVRRGMAPGAAAAIAQWDGRVWRCGIGSAGRYDPFGPDEVEHDTWYDLASITKSVTALAVARAVEEGLMTWDEPLSSILPNLSGTPGGHASLLHHLSHRAGLIAHCFVDERRDAGLTFIANGVRPQLAPAGQWGYEPIYSDLGYLLIGEALERATGAALDVWMNEQLGPVLGHRILSSRQLVEHGTGIERVAPTEVSPERGGLIRGQPHDENAWSWGETNTCGHAGLFGTAGGVLEFGKLLLDLVHGRSRALSSTSLSRLLEVRGDGTLRAGFDGKSLDGPSSVGSALGPRTFGHLGFTGTSYWCDPDTQTVVVLLTNRVCPTRTNAQIRLARPTLHEALARLARSVIGRPELR